MPSEDVQPNELRLNRKGSTHVPLVRTSHPRGAPRGHFRGFPQRGRGYYAGGNQARPPVPSVAHVGPARTSGHLPGPSTSASLHYHADSSSVSNKSRPETYKHERHPFTHKREHSHYDHSQGPPHKVSRTSEYPQHAPTISNARRTSNAPRRQHVIVPLPNDCHQGVPYYRLNRERWAQNSIHRIAMERGINVVGHEFFGRDQAKLFYYPLAGDAPIASGSRDLPPPAGLPNPVPTHQSQPPISEQLRKLAESPQLAALLQSCKNDHIDPKVEAPCPASIDAIPSVSKRTNISQPPSKQPLSITPVSQPSPRLAPPTPRPLKSSPPGVQRPLPPPASSAAPKPQAPVITSSRPSAAPVCKPEPSDIIDLTLSSAPPKPAVSVLVSSRPPAAPRSKPEPSDTIDLTLSSDDIPKHEPEPEVIPSSLPEDYEEDELAGDVTPPPPEPSSAGKQRAPVQTTDCLLVASGTLTLDSQYGMKIKAGAAKSLLRSRQPGPSERTPSPQDMSRSPSPEPSEPIGGMSAGDHGTHAGRDSSGMSDQGAHANDSIDETAQLRAVEWTQRGEVTIRAAFNNYDKPRRLLTGSARGLVTVSMRGAVDLVTWKSKKRTTLVRPSERSGELVDDACMLRTTDDKTYTLLAHTRNRNQLSLLRVRTSGEPVAPVLLTRPSERGSTNAGASVVCAMLQPGAFATGGYDHKVHLWNAPGDVTQATARELPLRHSACVHALLPVRDTSHKLLSAGADCRVGVYELASERVVHAFKVSNAVYHLHDAGLPYCALFEVAHRELQFEMRDYRMVPERPVQRFGFNMEVLQGRHAKGDIKDFYFACGDREGNVRLWDIRKADKPVSIVNCFPGHRTVQVAFRGQELVVCSDDFQVKFLGPASD